MIREVNMKNLKISYNLFRKKLDVEKSVNKVHFKITGNNEYSDCWLSYNKENEQCLFHYNNDGIKAYNFSSVDEALNSPIFDNKSMHELWDKVVIDAVNDLSANDWFLCECVKFRRCRKQAANNVAKLACKLWQGSDFDELKADFQGIVTRKNEIVFTAYIDGRMIGFVHCNLRKEYVEGTESCPVAYLEGIYVEQEFRNVGVATYLISYCEKWAKEKGCTELASDCDIENISSRKMHESNNFKGVSKLVHYVKELN